MVDKELKFLSTNDKYGVVENTFTNKSNTIGKIVYSNGEPLKYGDEAEIFGVLNLEEEFNPFMKSGLSEAYFSREHYWYTFGYQPADYENEEIKATDVKIHYAGVDNIITKKEFYELCLLLCEAKLNGLDLIEDKEVCREELLSIKTQLEEKMKAV